MKLQEFNGGINTREAPYLLKVSEGQTYTNINNDSGQLESVKVPLATGETYTNKHRYIKFSKEIIELAKQSTSFVEYKNKVYYAVDDDFIQMKDDNTEGDLGLWQPTLVSIEGTEARPAAPVSGDITASYTVLQAFIGFSSTYSGFAPNTTYQFAIQREDDEGRLSDILLWNWTNPTANYVLLNFSVPYKYKIYLRTGGVWREARGTTTRRVGSIPSGFFYWAETSSITLIRIGTASESIPFSPGIFLLETGYVTDNTRLYIPNLGVYWYGFSYIDTGEVPASYGTTSVEVDLLTVLSNGVDLPDGTYYYIVETYSSTLGWVSEASNTVKIIITSGLEAKLEIGEYDPNEVGTFVDTTVTDSRIDQLRIYRLGGNFTDFTRIATIDNPTFPYTFVDNITEVSVQGSPILDSEDNDKPPIGLSNLAIVNGQLCGTLGSRLYFSRTDKPYAMAATNYRDFRETLTGIYNIDAGLIVCSLTNTWLLNTSNLAVGKVIKISDEYGCTEHNAIVGYKTGAMWSSLYGICASFGGKVDLVTKNQINFTNLNIIRAEVYKETYWGFTEQGIIWALDLRFKPALKYFDFTLFADNLSNTKVNQVYREDASLRLLWGSDVNSDEYTLFAGTDKATLSWKSAKFVEGKYSERKTYKDIFVRASGKLTFKTYIEDTQEGGDLVAETVINGLETYHIKVDSELLQGYAIWFEATGTGIVYEIEYRAMGRQSGR